MLEYSIRHKRALISTGCIILVIIAVVAIVLKWEMFQQINQPIIPHNTTTPASNTWFSDLYKEFPSQPLYTLPSAFTISPAGLGISTPNVVKTANTIDASYQNDFTLGFQSPIANLLPQSPIQSIGDWSVQLQVQTTDKQESMNFTLAEGVPYTVIHTIGKQITATFPQSFAAYSNNSGNVLLPGTILFTKSLYITTMINTTNNPQGHQYILGFGRNTQVQVTNQSIIINNPATMLVGSLPARDTYNSFLSLAGSDASVSGTQAFPVIQNNQLQTTYQIITQSHTDPLITILPHQYAFLSEKPKVLGTYTTIRGAAELIQASSFTTNQPLLTPPDTFPVLAQTHSDFNAQLNNDIQSVLNGALPEPSSRDYALGTWLGEDTTLLQLADMSHNTNKASLLQFIESRFVDAVSPSSNNFYYDSVQKSLIATHPEFGNQYMNDHHFHYGYYIRTAAVLSRMDPSFYMNDTQNWQKTINLMVSDIATNDRTSKAFPYLRNFDVYQGHSWASGYDGFVPANGTTAAGIGFADGPNQESSSEAMNAWYSIYLWSEVTQNAALKDTALYLYNTEMEGTFFYWFGENKLYTSPYQHAIASLVWDGKVDFATFFGDDTFFKYGIQLLPFTPGSVYLSKLPASTFAQYSNDYHTSLSNNTATPDISNGGRGSETGIWGDLFTMWESMYQPQQTIIYRNSIPMSFFSATNPYYHQIPRSLFLYELYQHDKQ